MEKLAWVIAAAALGVLQSGAAFAQTDGLGTASRNSPASLRCSALADIEEAERAAAIYFLAGYNSGERDAMTFATVGIGEAPAAGTDAGAGAATPEQQTAAEAEPQAGGEAATGGAPANAGGPPAAMLPTIDADAILAACAQSPDSRIVDIITAQGAQD